MLSLIGLMLINVSSVINYGVASEITDYTYKIFVSTRGKETNSGTVSSPVNSLQGAHNIAENILRKSNNLRVNIEVLIEPGEYLNNSVRWLAIPKDGSLLITGIDGGDKRPVFDGSGLGATRFITFVPNFSGPTNITIAELQVKNYFEGITFSGPKVPCAKNPCYPNNEDIERGISNNRVKNIQFIRIGNTYKSDTNHLAEAVVRLVNTRSSQFLGNDFIDISNTSGSGLHSFYIAHNSSDNIVKGNKFINASAGSAIKIRDRSNNNIIKNNYFENAEKCLHIKHQENENVSVGMRVEQNIFRDNLCFANSHGDSRPKVFIEGQGSNRDQAYSGELNLNKDYYLIRSLDPSGNYYYGICTDRDACINSKGICFNQNSGSEKIVCRRDSTWMPR